MLEDITDDVEDCAIPQKSIIACPFCKENKERRVKCFLCKGRGFLFVSEEHTRWIEEDLFYGAK